MNQQLTPAELATLPVAIPILTKRDKLFRLAQLVRSAPYQVTIFSGIEYMSLIDKRMAHHPNSVFALAAADPLLKDAGMTSDSVAEGERFFELASHELHAFSCDCGGRISNSTMARRIETIAVSM
jgi:hypothetical protein